MIFDDIKQLVEEIQSHHLTDAIIGVDGWIGAGKTMLAKALANTTGGKCFDLDTALESNRDCYVDALCQDELSRNLTVGGLLFVSGICLSQALSLVRVNVDLQIYVKRMATWGWADEDEVLGNMSEVVGASGTSLRKEMRLYHKMWKPHLLSTYEFHRQS